jgi:hypothetical protein
MLGYEDTPKEQDKSRPPTKCFDEELDCRELSRKEEVYIYHAGSAPLKQAPSRIE